MSKGSRRRVGSPLGFESLEQRSLLSGFSGPAPPVPGRSVGPQDPPPAMVSGPSSNAPGQCSGPTMSAPPRPSISDTGRQPPGGMPHPDGAPAPPASSTIPFEQGGSPAGQTASSVPGRAPSGSIAAAQTSGAGSEPAAPAPISPAIARPFGGPNGLGPSHAGKAAASPDIEVAGAPGVDPAAPGSPAPAPGVDPAVGPATAFGAGTGRSALVSLGLTALTVLITPDWAIQSDSTSAPEQAALPPGVALGNDKALEPTASVTAALPLPRGAGLMTGFSALQATQLDECLARLFDRSDSSSEPADQLAQTYPYLVEIALAVFAVELTRRWRQRSTRTPRPSRRSRFFVLSSLL